MSRQPDNNHYVRRVVLPSGKMIEVVYFEDPVGAPHSEHDIDAERTDVGSQAADLHVCARCESDLVYPTEWDEASTSHWEVARRCPNCEWTNTGIFEQEIVERFDEELDRGTETLVRDLKRLMHANMEDEIECFVSALELDQILPEDF